MKQITKINPSTWSEKDRNLYMHMITLLYTIEKTDSNDAWRWAMHIVHVNKYNKENTNETK